MENLPCSPQRKSFYEVVQNSPDVDCRDNRGKRHDLAIVLAGFSAALLCKRDGNLSSIHRHMKNHYSALCQFLGILVRKAVSRSQLPLILAQVNLPALEALIFGFYGIQLTESEKKWFSIDGKELRGSIQKGDKRGEAIVQLVVQQTGEVKGQTFYSGKKESEQPAIRDLLIKSKVLSQKISADALHLNPTTLQLIHESAGVYLVGLKENQAEMLEEMHGVLKRQSIPARPAGGDYQQDKSEKGHGRVDRRRYEARDVRDEYFDRRWEKCGLATLITVNRTRFDCKTRQSTEELSFYMSNEIARSQKQADELFLAVRNHWSVETTNHVRDVSLAEDKLRTKKTTFQKPLRQLEH